MIPIETTPQELVDQFLDTVKLNKSSTYYKAVLDRMREEFAEEHTQEITDLEKALESTGDEITSLEQEIERLEKDRIRLLELLDEHNITY